MIAQASPPSPAPAPDLGPALSGAFWSDEIRLIAAPFRGYRALAARRTSGASLARRVATTLLFVGAVGSFTTAGRLEALHMLSIALSWSFVVAMHAATATLTSRLCVRRLPIARAVELHMAGNGPYFVFLLSLAAIVLFAPDVAATLTWLVSSRLLPVAAGLTAVGGAVTSFGFYRVCGGSSVRRSFALLGVEWALKIVWCLAWYALIDNLAPQFLGARGGA